MTTLSDLDVVALTIWGEARGESLEGKAAVGNVIRNRLKLGRWGHTYESVCLAPWQFSCWRKEGGQANYLVLQAFVSEVQQGRTPDDPVLRECYGLAQGVTSGWLRDNVAKASHYFVTQSTMPKWAINQVPVKVIGRHSFFAGIK